mmetsp:Transcript_32379/g.82564  ORF Transcript_32379/g.82564 Transcript_32379/m.82564 type:complete len:417 (+) Transcript_32379:7871-9121(+)
MVAVTSALSSRPMSTVLKRGIVATVLDEAAPLAASALMRTPVMRGVTAAIVVTENSSDQTPGPIESFTEAWLAVTPSAGSLIPLSMGTVTTTSASKAAVFVEVVSCRIEEDPNRVKDIVSNVSGAEVTAPVMPASVPPVKPGRMMVTTPRLVLEVETSSPGVKVMTSSDAAPGASAVVKTSEAKAGSMMVKGTVTASPEPVLAALCVIASAWMPKGVDTTPPGETVLLPVVKPVATVKERLGAAPKVEGGFVTVNLKEYAVASTAVPTHVKTRCPVVWSQAAPVPKTSVAEFVTEVMVPTLAEALLPVSSRSPVMVISSFATNAMLVVKATVTMLGAPGVSTVSSKVRTSKGTTILSALMPFVTPLSAVSGRGSACVMAMAWSAVAASLLVFVVATVMDTVGACAAMGLVMAKLHT